MAVFKAVQNNTKYYRNLNSKNNMNTATSFIKIFYKNLTNYEYIKSLLSDPKNLSIITILILIVEFIFNIVIINTVRYTEIDWIAYMQECEGFLNGTTNYSEIRGDTGPLVYPAGFVYIYTILYYITSYGKNIRLAQYIFAIIYLIQMYLVLRLYTKCEKCPPYVLILSTFTSYRVHSIYILRLFNDPIAILFLYMAINLFLDQKWILGSIIYSFAISIKMNILLFAPAVLLLYITNLGWSKTIKQLLICGFVQLLLGSPFLLTYPFDYIKGSFNFGRIFEHKWTVNYRFLDIEIFENRLFHLLLLSIHIILLFIFFMPSYTYMKNYCRLRELEKQFQPQIDKENFKNSLINKKRKQQLKNEMKSNQKNQNNRSSTITTPVESTLNDENLSKEQEEFLNKFKISLQKSTKNQKNVNNDNSNGQKNKFISETTNDNTEKYSIHFDKSTQLVLLPIFLCNFIGILCARSLHYQFYIWYFHSLPYLCWSTDYNLSIKFLLLGLIELCWNTYPSTNKSSILLHLCHITLLIGVGIKFLKSYLNSKKIVKNYCKNE